MRIQVALNKRTLTNHMKYYKTNNPYIKYFLHKSSWIRRAHNIGLSFNVIALIVFFSLLSTITEVFGIGIFLPIFQFIRMDGDLDALAADSNIWPHIIDALNYFNIEVSLLALLLLSFFFFLGRQIFIYVRLIYTEAVTQRLIQHQRNCLFDMYIEADTSYHDSTPVGNLVNIIMVEVNKAVSGVMSPIGLIVYIVMLIGYLSMLFVLSWQMTIASIIILLIASIAPKVWINQSMQTGRRLVNANTQMSEFLVGRLKSPRLVRLAGTERAEKDEFNNLTLSQRKYQVFGSMLKAKTTVAMDPIVIGLSLSFLYVSYTVLHLQIEVIGLYLVIALRLMPVVQSILLQYQAIQGSIGSIEILENRFTEMERSREQDNGSMELIELNQSILFSNIFYRYPTGKGDALKNVTIEIKANKFIAIVGPSGSGKSTLIDLMPRLRLSNKGLIKIDGVNIEKYTLKSLRHMISYAPQFPQIFDGTVKNHILYGKKSATDDEVRQAAYLAGAEEFINELPLGFDTSLGEDAVQLSGGQRQRLDLARALVGEAPILILDEPTSNLDAESEEAFSKVLDKIREDINTTIIVVAHRLASISNSDNIIVLNQGEVEACGTHSELLNHNGWYAKAWKMQSLEE